MRLYLRAILTTGLVALILAWGFSAWRERSQPKEGERKLSQLDTFESRGVPDFQVKAIDGKDFQLKDHKGKVVIINFWASWCGPCLEEMPSLISLVESQAGRVHLVAVSADNTQEDIDAFLKAFPKVRNPNIDIVWDQDQNVARKYSVDRLPESFIVGKDMKLVRKIIGSINWHTPDSEAFMKELIK
jgi:cytochrome c biogenesis protein CcmG, thiol:disulfide interchange protein DsbE